LKEETVILVMILWAMPHPAESDGFFANHYENKSVLSRIPYDAFMPSSRRTL